MGGWFFQDKILRDTGSSYMQNLGPPPPETISSTSRGTVTCNMLIQARCYRKRGDRSWPLWSGVNLAHSSSAQLALRCGYGASSIGLIPNQIFGEQDYMAKWGEGRDIRRWSYVGSQHRSEPESLEIPCAIPIGGDLQPGMDIRSQKKKDSENRKRLTLPS
ncbi:hypothetical protein V2G26_010038 [Clonostachys chloroleuca]